MEEFCRIEKWHTHLLNKAFLHRKWRFAYRPGFFAGNSSWGETILDLYWPSLYGSAFVYNVTHDMIIYLKYTFPTFETHAGFLWDMHDISWEFAQHASICAQLEWYIYFRYYDYELMITILDISMNEKYTNDLRFPITIHLKAHHEKHECTRTECKFETVCC